MLVKWCGTCFLMWLHEFYSSLGLLTWMYLQDVYKYLDFAYATSLIKQLLESHMGLCHD